MASAQSDKVQALTIITPIRQGFVLIEEPRIEIRYLDRIKHVLEIVKAMPREQNGIELLATVHFARWAILDDGQRLLFTSNYVGQLDAYLMEFSIKLAPWVDAVWANCDGYPGAANSDAFRQWVRDHQIPEAYSYAANPDITVKDVRWLKAFYGSYQQLVRDAQAHPERLPELFAALQRRMADSEANAAASAPPSRAQVPAKPSRTQSLMLLGLRRHQRTNRLTDP